MSLNSEHRRRKEDERVPLYPEAQAGYSNGRGQGSSGDVEEAGRYVHLVSCMLLLLALW